MDGNIRGPWDIAVCSQKDDDGEGDDDAFGITPGFVSVCWISWTAYGFEPPKKKKIKDNSGKTLLLKKFPPRKVFSQKIKTPLMSSRLP